MKVQLSMTEAVRVAAEATASLTRVGRVGYTAAESLQEQRSGSISIRERATHVERHQLALRAMSTAVRDAAGSESNADRKRILFSTASALDALSGVSALCANVRLSG